MTVLIMIGMRSTAEAFYYYITMNTTTANFEYYCICSCHDGEGVRKTVSNIYPVASI